MDGDIYFKDGKVFKKSSGLGSLFLPDEELGELQDKWDGGQKVVDVWGSAIGSVEREPLWGDAKAKVGDQTGVITEGGFLEGELTGLKVFRPDRAVEDTSVPATWSDSDRNYGGTYDLSRPFGSGKSAPQKTLIMIARFVAAVVAATITGVITFFISMIVVGLFFNIVMGLNSLTGWTFLVFVFGWLLPPLLVFIVVSGIGDLIVGRRRL